MIIYLGLGSNLGDRVKNLRLAIEKIKNIPNVELLRVSSFYETAAWGVTNQPDFINAAIKIRTTLEPLKLLDALQKIEIELEINRHEHWAPRLIDIDILLIDDLKINSERLTVPHKFLNERDFVKIPLAEISPLKFNLRGDKVQKIFSSPIDFNLKLVACVDKNFGLGYKGDLLFRIDEDLKNLEDLHEYCLDLTSAVNQILYDLNANTIKWSDLDKIKPQDITIKNVNKYLKRKDPWSDFPI